MVDLSVRLNRLLLRNPIMVASGTFGYAREMAGFVPFEKLGGIVPKTVTPAPRIGNPPPRTCETASGMLNSIGLDNDGLDQFIAKHWPYLARLPTAVVANIAGHDADEFSDMARKLGPLPGLAGLELNISCPNVAGGVDFATDPRLTQQVVRRCRDVCPVPILAKLTPNVADVVPIARAALDGGADAVTLINTLQGMAVDWRQRKPLLGNVLGGLSGPAIKPVALRIVWQVARKVPIPIIGVGGIADVNDVLEFLVAGASAVQVGTASFYQPSLAGRLADDLAAELAAQGLSHVSEIVGTLRVP